MPPIISVFDWKKGIFGDWPFFQGERSGRSHAIDTPIGLAVLVAQGNGETPKIATHHLDHLTWVRASVVACDGHVFTLTAVGGLEAGSIVSQAWKNRISIFEWLSNCPGDGNDMWISEHNRLTKRHRVSRQESNRPRLTLVGIKLTEKSFSSKYQSWLGFEKCLFKAPIWKWKSRELITISFRGN